jgi:uncharacterized protein with FMN-binding domain
LRTEPNRRSADAGAAPTPARLAPPPRRAVAAIAATALGLVLLFSFKTPDSPTDATAPLAVAHATPMPGITSPAGPRATSRPGSVGPASPSPSSATQAPAAARQQVDGDVISTQFGDIQVRLVETGGQIVDVQALQLPSDRRRSREISQYSEPVLHDEALQAQSAKIDSVSGATYTSEAYRESLQSALDRVHG